MKNLPIKFAFLCLHISAIAVADVETRSAEVKASEQWSRIVESSYGVNVPEISGPGAWEALSLLNADFDSKAFSHDGDAMIEGRTKLIHGFGRSALVEFVPQEGNPFTGVFKTGVPFGLLRVSVAVPPEVGSDSKFVPGFGLKFFIDNKASLNLLAMPSLDGQPERNIFAHDYTTNVAAPAWSIKTWLLEQRFTSALGCVGQSDGNPRSLAFNQMAEMTSMGKKVENPVAPFELVFAPTKALYDLFESRPSNDFRESLEGMGEGMVLFDVFSKDSKGGEPIAVGTLRAKSNFIASSYGDKVLFFKHPPVHNWSEFPTKDQPEL